MPFPDNYWLEKAAGPFKRYANRGAAASATIKAAPGTVRSLSCYNANASTRYVQLHNKAVVASASDVPYYSFMLPSGSMIIIGNDFFGMGGSDFDTGITFAFSTTQDTYTAGAAADQSTIVHYR